jgi:predicted enzyme related to lactoylglutathione lyase
MPATFPRGRFVWHALITTDPDAASTFYSSVLGWKSQPWERDPAYRVWMMGKRPTGGLVRLPDEARRTGGAPRWMPYVAVPDVDGSVRQAQGLGARVDVAPRDIPPGRVATLTDPWGAVFSVFRPSSDDDMGTDAPEAGSFAWHEHVSQDWTKAWDFYSALFGWEHESSLEMGPGNTYFMYKRAGTSQAMGGFYNSMPDQHAPPAWLCYVEVPSADTAAAAVQRAGGQVLSGPMEVPGGGRIAILVDAQGAAFAVHAAAARPVRRSRAAAKPKRSVKRKVATKPKTKPRSKSKPKPKPKPKRRTRPRAKRRPTRRR